MGREWMIAFWSELSFRRLMRSRKQEANPSQRVENGALKMVLTDTTPR